MLKFRYNNDTSNSTSHHSQTNKMMIPNYKGIVHLTTMLSHCNLNTPHSPRTLHTSSQQLTSNLITRLRSRDVHWPSGRRRISSSVPNSMLKNTASGSEMRSGWRDRRATAVTTMFPVKLSWHLSSVSVVSTRSHQR